MSIIKPVCMYCKNEIQKTEDALVIVPYPKKKGFTEVQAFLKLEGKFVCTACQEKLRLE